MGCVVEEEKEGGKESVGSLRLGVDDSGVILPLVGPGAFPQL